MSKHLSLAILAYPGALQSAVLGLQDVLSHAARLSGTVLELTVLEEVDGTAGSFAAVVLPPSAGQVRADSMPALPGFLARQHGAGTVICSACTGLFFVAAAGLAGGRKVTTHWALESRFAEAHPDVILDTDQLLIEYTDLITAGGLMAWIDLALVLIERFMGHRTAVETARHFIVEFRRKDQRRFRRFVPDLRHGDRAVLKAQHCLELRLAEGVPVESLAEASGLPRRTFQRRFKAATGLAPKTYHQELRIERARDLLVETGMSVAEVCFAVGYADVPSFGRLFAQRCGLAPGAFRDRFKRPACLEDLT